MDKLSIFGNRSFSETRLTYEYSNLLATIASNQSDIVRELRLTRKGNEAFIYGEEVEGSDEVDLSDVEEIDG